MSDRLPVNPTRPPPVLGVTHVNGGDVRPVHRTCAAAAIALATLLGVLLLLGELSWRGWAVGALAGAAGLVLLARASGSAGRRQLGPADLVTLVRLVLSCAVCALVLDPVPDAASPVVASVIALVAILLDGIDGRVARRTGTASELGARFDMETDAFLILVLSVGVAPLVGAWALLVGLARYLFVAASWAWPLLDRTLPPRHWRKVVAASTAIVLALVLPGRLTDPVAVVGVGVVTLLVAESFGRDVGWLVRHRGDDGAAPSRLRARSAVLTATSVALVWIALTIPGSAGAGVSALARVPVEALVLAAVVLLVPRHAARPIAVAVGAVVGVSAVLRLLDLGFEAALGRPFRPTSDWTYAGAARDLLIDAVGAARAWAIAGLGLLVLVVLLVLVPLAADRLVARGLTHRTPASAVVVSAVAAGAVVASFSLHAPHSAFTAAAADAVVRDVALVATQTHQDNAFGEVLHTSESASTRVTLDSLRGKDVLVVFVESYGRSALETIPQAAEVRAHLDAGTATLAQHGVGTRSAFLTSPTFGGISWLAHATLQSGLWIDSQSRYDELMTSRRATLADDFHRAGWRTVADVPSNERVWPEGRSFYHYDQIYDEASIGYRGPRFSYAAVPDQFTLEAFRRAELVPGHPPVMAEIDLVSSHSPWTPLPHLLPAAALGDGSGYDSMPEQGPAPAQVWTDPAKVKASYAQSIEYSIDSIVAFVATAHDPDLVVVMLGDHAPSAVVSGVGSSHDVPVTLLSSDPHVLARISGWGWQRGLDPAPGAPVWRMDAFRDRFLSAFSGAA
jgi:phosphatidylglycerophosphate synthase